MLKDWIRKLGTRSIEPVPFDPSTLEDEVALRTEWSPAKGGGASFGTHRLVAVRHDRMEFAPKAGAIVFFGVFLLVGVGVALTLLLGIAQSGAPQSAKLVGYALPMLIGAVFGGVGSVGLYWVTAPVVFDRGRGTYWKGRTPPHEALRRDASKDQADLDDVHAVQVVSELCRSDKSSYYSYELNLVLKDGSRLNVVDHGDYALLARDARALADFLDRPLWDAVPD